jgi:putative ABC transport system permease protein
MPAALPLQKLCKRENKGNTMIQIALRNLVLAKKRTLLIGAAIASVAFLFVVLLAAGKSVSNKIMEAATTLSAGHINISGFYKRTQNGANPIISNKSEILALANELFPNASQIITRHRGWGRIISSESSLNAGLTGIELEQESRLLKTLVLAKKSDGSVAGNLQDIQKENSAIIFAGQAKKLGVNVGDPLTLVIEANDTGTNSVDLTVVAIAEDVGFLSNFQIFVPTQTILNLYQLNSETTGAVMVYFNNPSQSESALGQAREALIKKGFNVMDYDPNPFFFKFDKVAGEDWLGQRYDLTIWKDEVSFVAWIASAFQGVTGFIIFILSIVIAAGIGNNMWMSVRERTKEIGTMRAVGATQAFILKLFMIEAVFLGIIFSFAGGVFATIFLFILNRLNITIHQEGIRTFLMSQTYNFPFEFNFIGTAIILFACVTSFAALLPSLRAAKLKPVEALMHSK